MNINNLTHALTYIQNSENRLDVIYSFYIMINKILQNPVIMTLDSEKFQSIFTYEVKKLLNVFKKYNYEIRLVGGAVR